MRPYGGYYANLGRETFLASVLWENGWPIINPGAGRVLAEFPAPLPRYLWPPEPARDDFDTEALAPVWNLLRTPREEFLSLTARPGQLRLRLRPDAITQPGNPSFVGRRQQHLSFVATTAMDFEPATASESAGLVLLRGPGHQIRLVVTAAGAQKIARVIVRRDGADRTVAQAPLAAGRTYLAAEAAGQEYTLRCTQDPARWQPLATVDGRVLSPAAAGDFTGAYLGMYACGDGPSAARFAYFDWFEYVGRSHFRGG